MYKERAPIYLGRMRKGLLIMLIFIIIEILASVLAPAMNNSTLGYVASFLPCIIGFAFSFVWIYLGQYLAAKRNRNPATWGILFLFTGMIALIILLISGEAKDKE